MLENSCFFRKNKFLYNKFEDVHFVFYKWAIKTATIIIFWLQYNHFIGKRNYAMHKEIKARIVITPPRP